MTPAPNGVAPTPTMLSGPIASETDRVAGPDRPRRRWYKRKRIMIPFVLLIIAMTVGGYAGWRIYDSFSTINETSTPPPVVSGLSLGGDSSIEIDTSPALAAVQTYEANQQQGASNAPTEPANDIALVVTPTTPAEATEVPATLDADNPTPTSETTTSVDGPTVPVESDQATEVPGTTLSDSGDTGSDSPTAPVVATNVPQLPQPTTAPLPEFGEDTLNILLMGVDATEGEAIDISVRPDALAVLHLDRETGSCRMLAIPRDTRVDLPGYGLSKINHALAVGGVPYQTQVVEQYLGITIDHYGLIDFSGVVKIVDEVGGVEVDNPAAFTSLGIDFPVGLQTLNGDEALAYARFRSDDQGDFGRIGRQQEVLRALLKKVSPGDLVGMIPQMLPLLVD
ncbi:MAG: LCP family protein, partial [Thermomicrobiales bacterium]